MGLKVVDVIEAAEEYVNSVTKIKQQGAAIKVTIID
jgi:hypothetical protein